MLVQKFQDKKNKDILIVYDDHYVIIGSSKTTKKFFGSKNESLSRPPNLYFYDFHRLSEVCESPQEIGYIKLSDKNYEIKFEDNTNPIIGELVFLEETNVDLNVCCCTVCTKLKKMNEKMSLLDIIHARKKLS
jgi:hypothetical protein